MKTKLRRSSKVLYVDRRVKTDEKATYRSKGVGLMSAHKRIRKYPTTKENNCYFILNDVGFAALSLSASSLTLISFQHLFSSIII